MLLDVLGSGCAVRFGALGTFYIAPVGLAANPGEKLPITVRFSPDAPLLNTVSKMEIADSVLALPSVEFGQITDAGRAAADGVLTAKTAACGLPLRGCTVGGAVLFLKEAELNIGRIFVAPEHFHKGYGIFMRDGEFVYSRKQR